MHTTTGQGFNLLVHISLNNHAPLPDAWTLVLYFKGSMAIIKVLCFMMIGKNAWFI